MYVPLLWKGIHNNYLCSMIKSLKKSKTIFCLFLTKILCKHNEEIAEILNFDIISH